MGGLFVAPLDLFCLFLLPLRPSAVQSVSAVSLPPHSVSSHADESAPVCQPILRFERSMASVHALLIGAADSAFRQLTQLDVIELNPILNG